MSKSATAERQTATLQVLREAEIDYVEDGGMPFVIRVEVSPAIAGDWLGRNRINRPLREPTVKKYAAMILEGRWRLNGDTIKFDSKGDLLDGQHRLTAILVSGETVPCFVAFNIESEAFATFDRPKKRSTADVLALKGEKNTAQLSAVLTWYWKYSEGRTRVMGPEGWPEPDNVLGVLEKHPGLRDSLAKVGTSRYKLLSGLTALAVTHYVLGSVDAEARDKFFELLATPSMLDENHPIFRLRERLFGDRVSKNKMAQHERIAIIYKAWNAWRAGRDIRQLAWRGSGDGREAFPEPE